MLLTNDDGVQAEGLKSLRAALIDIGLDVVVIAPSDDQSGRARAVSCVDPVEVEELERDPRTPVFACTGTPVDCVRIGILSDLVGSVDAVVSGINHGVNLGDDATVSGTLGAALEGGLLGIPSIAFSQQDDAGAVSLVSRGEHSFEQAPFAAEMVRLRMRADLPTSFVFNVNIPSRVSGAVALTRFSHFDYPRAWIRSEDDGDGRRKVWSYAHPDGPDPEMERGPGTDVAAIEAGVISLTLVSSDWSCRRGPAAGSSKDRLGEEATRILGETIVAPSTEP